MLHAKQMPTNRSIWPLTLLVYQTNPRTATSEEAMDKESMSDQMEVTPSWPPPATAITVPSLPLQHHVQLALIGWTRLGSTAIHHLHDNKPQDSVTQNTNKFY
jgi:hypothetical protein